MRRNQTKVLGGRSSARDPDEMEVFDGLPPSVRAAISSAPYKIKSRKLADRIAEGTEPSVIVARIELEMRRLLNLNAVA